LRIIQANIWQGKLGLQIIDFLKEQQPDFVCMQEVNDLPGRAGYKFFATLEELQQADGFGHSFLSATYNSRYMERKLRYGNAILSRLPLTATETIFTHGEFIENFDITKDDGNIRNVQHVSVEVDDKTLHILNHHGFRIPETKAGNEDTMRSMRIIADIVAKLDGPVILCGDFNLAPDSKSIGIINAKLRNLSIENGLTRTYTDLSIVDAVCDYIFVNDQVKVQRFEMSEALISDHKALILDFEI
jgi:endonuclease/exonuclease/phosphatase family metal-dependent hydrolase